MDAPALPPGLDAPAAQTDTTDGVSSSEAHASLAKCCQEGNLAGALELLSRTTKNGQKVNAHMINMLLSLELAPSSQMSVEAAAVNMLKRCTEYGVQANAALHNNVLAALSNRCPPEAVLSWLARMRDSGVGIDVYSCNIQLKAHLAMKDLGAASSLLSTMMRGNDPVWPRMATHPATPHPPPPLVPHLLSHRVFTLLASSSLSAAAATPRPRILQHGDRRARLGASAGARGASLCYDARFGSRHARRPPLHRCHLGVCEGGAASTRR